MLFCNWLQEAGTSSLSVAGSDHSLRKGKDLLSVYVGVCVCLWEAVVCFEPEITFGFLSVNFNI